MRWINERLIGKSTLSMRIMFARFLTPELENTLLVGLHDPDD